MNFYYHDKNVKDHTVCVHVSLFQLFYSRLEQLNTQNVNQSETNDYILNKFSPSCLQTQLCENLH